MVDFIIVCALILVGLVCGIFSIVKAVRAKKAKREALNEHVTTPTDE